jgi:hypothetical protein
MKSRNQVILCRVEAVSPLLNYLSVTPKRYVGVQVQLQYYSASLSRVAPENVGLQKEQNYNTFVCHTCNEVRLCVLGIRKKEIGNTKR